MKKLISRIGFLTISTMAVLAITASVAMADFGIAPGSFEVRAEDEAGQPLTQAGGHPDFTTSFMFNTATNMYGDIVPDGGDLKDTRVKLPVGFVGNPGAAEQCPMADFAQGESPPQCSPSTQVGIADIYIGWTEFNQVSPLPWEVRRLAIYNLTPAAGEPARFGFRVGKNNVVIETLVRSDSDYGITTTVRNAPGGVIVYGASLTFWGVPAAPSHDPLRFMKGEENFPGRPSEDPENPNRVPISLSLPEKPFLSLPTNCEATPTATIEVSSWQEPNKYVKAESSLPVPSGCDKLSFRPGFSVEPDNSTPASPSGYRVAFDFKSNEDETGPLAPALRDAVVTLPKGVAVSPPSADGLAGCSPEQVGLDSLAPASCPAASTLGDVTIKTPLLDEPLVGHAYLAEPTASQLLKLYLVAQGSGVTVKLAGNVDPDPVTGQLTATFRNNPQLPVSQVALDLKSGPRAALANPRFCGDYASEAALTPWSSLIPTVLRSWTSFAGNCSRGSAFAPTLAAGPVNPQAGASSPFVLDVSRPEGQQNISRISATLAAGQLAKLAGVPLCPEQDAANGSCPTSSRVGDVTVAVGEGSNPLYVPQPGKAPTAAYLAGPYKGAPYSLVVKVPAQAGPFDLGDVAVRSALAVDPVSARVTASSDPLPQILKGIPLSYRQVHIAIDRNGFMVNPTSCEPQSVEGTIASSEGASRNVSAPLQVANCANLGFKPALKLKVSGGMKRGSFPALRAELKAPQGQANIGRVSVALPHSEFLAQSHIRTICTRVQYAAKQCPPGSVYGWARAFTPLLDQPLEGPVYLRSSSNPLPDLVASLDGQIHIDLAGRIDSKNGGIRNTFEAVPDAPVTKFVLTMKGGKKGLLENSRNLCAGANKATVKMDGQNGKAHDFRPVVGNSCGGKKRK